HPRPRRRRPRARNGALRPRQRPLLGRRAGDLHHCRRRPARSAAGAGRDGVRAIAPTGGKELSRALRGLGSAIPHPRSLPLEGGVFTLDASGLIVVVHTNAVLPSGLTRGPAWAPRNPGFLHVDRGPRVKPEGSPVWGINCASSPLQTLPP